ncbi:hypothetical protein RHS03_08028, partial [Rhizoctonia solani]
MLREDPNDVSATALTMISRALAAIATSNSSAIQSADFQLPIQSNVLDFTPPKVAIWINVLWYSSFSLSTATAFMAMLAKDWCYSFKAKRTGHAYDQAHRRQRKWRMIQSCGMQEVIEALPSLMHLSLLLFSVGLYLFLMDLNQTVATSVMYIGGLFMAFYVATSVAGTFVDDFPYTTVISRILRSKYMEKIYKSIYKPKIMYKATSVAILIRNLAVLIIAMLYLVPLTVSSWLIVPFISIAIVVYQHLAHFIFKKHREPHTFTKTRSKLDQKVETLATLPLKLVSCYLDLKSWTTKKLKYLHPTEELIAILALRWLIEHCETPSAIDIALQAISGARKEMENEQLLSCKATQEIITRIASQGDISGLYTRGLEFLKRTSANNSINDRDKKRLGKKRTEKEGSKRKTPQQDRLQMERPERANGPFHEPRDDEKQEEDGKEGRTEDIVRVMFWDLNSKNECKVLERLGDKPFMPNPTNIEAMNLGNVVALRSLNDFVSHNHETDTAPSGNAASVDEQMNISPGLSSIAELFAKSSQSEHRLLHPAAVQSLANAIALNASLLANSKPPPGLIMSCIQFCQRLSNKENSTNLESMELEARELEARELESEHNIETGAVFVVCILLLDQLNRDAPLSIARSHNCAISTARILTKLYRDHSIFSRGVFLVGCSKILSNPIILKDAESERRHLENWCSTQTTWFIDQCGPSSLDRWNLDHRSADEKRSKFLKAVSKVYGLEGVPGSGGLQLPDLAESTYIILIMIAICNQPNSQQSQYCHKLLSKFAFPVPTIRLLETHVCKNHDHDRTVLSTLWNAYNCEKRRPTLHRLFAATQLWLLLNPPEDNINQEDQDKVKQHLNLYYRGYTDKKEEIKNYIISRYRDKDRTPGSQENSRIIPQSTEVWKAVKSTFKKEQRSNAVGQLVRQFGDGLNQFDSAPDAYSYERGYLKRVVESMKRKDGRHESQYGNQEPEVGKDTRRSNEGTQAGPSASTPRVAPESAVTPGSTRHEAPGVSTRQWRLTFRADEDTNPAQGPSLC